MELLLAGRLDAACLPEPLLSVAASKGAALLAKSDDSGLGAGVIAFSAAAIDGRLADIAGLYRAYWRAARRIDAAPDSYRGFLVDKAGFPAPIRDSYAFVVYRKPRLPSAADLAAVLDWMKARGLIKSDPGIGSDGTGLVDAAGLVDARVLAEASKGW
jgi:NitT/TauT family transport system substrate-binding protein